MTDFSQTGWIRIRSYCICGSKLDAYSAPPDAARSVHEKWRELHTGEGHGEADAAQARKARRKAALA